jgi:putative lipoic acid-binding regulatory protein
MGLDQQAYTKDKDGQYETIQDWRKHNALDGWMQSLWKTKGGTGEWNCAEVELNAHDIEQLEAVVVNDELPETQGFFYGGDSRECPHRKQETLDFVKEAGKLLSSGEKVYYSAWF